MNYREIYSQDFCVDGISCGHINWKDTDICISLYCQCGYKGHFDGAFFRWYECPQCHKKYALGSYVKLIPLTEEQTKEVEERTCGFKTCLESTGEYVVFKGWDEKLKG